MGRTQSYPEGRRVMVISGAASEKLLNAQEVAEYLGLGVSTIYEWASNNRIPCLHVGNRLRFDRSDILRWLEARKEEDKCPGNRNHEGE